MPILRVLQISYDMSLGGAETLIMNLYRNIDRDRLQFDFLLHSPEESAYEKEIKELGGRIYRIPRYKGYNKLSYEKNLTIFLREHEEFSIIHDHLMDSASETLKVAKRMGRTVIAHSHIADVPLSLEELLRRFFRKNLWRISDYRFACSNAAGLWLYKGKADFKVLRNGIETEKYRFNEETRERVRRSFNLADTTKLYGTIGRLETQKNQSRMLGIFKSITEKTPDSVLMIIGTGSLEAELKGKASSLGISDKVIFPGPRKDVNEILMGMDAFILTSLYEGLGIVLVEAQASGLNCFYTDTIPADVDLIPSLLHRISLDSEDEVWAESILSIEQKGNRANCPEMVREKGYDIRETAKELEIFYLGLYAKTEKSKMD